MAQLLNIYYFVRKIQIYYDINISIDSCGLAGPVWCKLGLVLYLN